MVGNKAVRSVRRHAYAWLAACLLIGPAPGLHAQSGDSDYFEVRSASHELIDGIYYVDAEIDLRLTPEARNALRSRLPLTIRVEVEFLNRLRFWWDLAEFTASERSQLRYIPLTDRYVVLNTETGQREDFATLDSALEVIGRVQNLPVARARDLDADRRYDIRVRAVLDKTELPGPLRFIALWQRDWSIASDWWQWRLDDE